MSVVRHRRHYQLASAGSQALSVPNDDGHSTGAGCAAVDNQHAHADAPGAVRPNRATQPHISITQTLSGD